MALTFDVAVVGSGVSGVSAALAAQARGASVCLIRAAPGATALCSGAWAGPLRAELRDRLAAAGLPLEPAPAPLLHERGRAVHAEYAGASHTGATDDRTVVGIAGLPHFNASILARTWQPAGALRAHTIELAGTPAAGWSTPALAAHIERDPAPLVAALRQAGIERAILPAVLGIDDAPAVLARVRAEVDVVEALAAAPSLPGWRLQQALDKACATAGITIVNGRATLQSANGRNVTALRVGEEDVVAGRFVLATGKFLGGGVLAEDEFRESVLDLPMWLEQLGDVFTAPDALPLTDPVRTADQPLLYAGVHTNDEQQPVGRARDVVYDNVFVAGTVRSGWSASERGLGDCAEDGWTAGERASA